MLGLGFQGRLGYNSSTGAKNLSRTDRSPVHVTLKWQESGEPVAFHMLQF